MNNDSVIVIVEFLNIPIVVMELLVVLGVSVAVTKGTKWWRGVFVAFLGLAGLALLANTVAALRSMAEDLHKGWVVISYADIAVAAVCVVGYWLAGLSIAVIVSGWLRKQAVRSRVILVVSVAMFMAWVGMEAATGAVFGLRIKWYNSAVGMVGLALWMVGIMGRDAPNVWRLMVGAIGIALGYVVVVGQVAMVLEVMSSAKSMYRRAVEVNVVLCVAIAGCALVGVGRTLVDLARLRVTKGKVDSCGGVDVTTMAPMEGDMSSQ